MGARLGAGGGVVVGKDGEGPLGEEGGAPERLVREGLTSTVNSPRK